MRRGLLLSILLSLWLTLGFKLQAFGQEIQKELEWIPLRLVKGLANECFLLSHSHGSTSYEYDNPGDKYPLIIELLPKRPFLPPPVPLHPNSIQCMFNSKNMAFLRTSNHPKKYEWTQDIDNSQNNTRLDWIPIDDQLEEWFETLSDYFDKWGKKRHVIYQKNNFALTLGVGRLETKLNPSSRHLYPIHGPGEMYLLTISKGPEGTSIPSPSLAKK